MNFLKGIPGDIGAAIQRELQKVQIQAKIDALMLILDINQTATEHINAQVAELRNELTKL